MEARKCDICGKLFMPYLDEENSITKTYNQLKINTRDMGTNVYNTDYYDLCEDCIRSLDKWLESRRDNNAETR